MYDSSSSSPTGRERRRIGRVSAVLPISIRPLKTGTSDTLLGNTRDICSDGLGIQALHPLLPGTQFLVHLRAKHGESMSLVYRVTWCSVATEGFSIGAALIGRASAAPTPVPTMGPHDILRRVRADKIAR